MTRTRPPSKNKTGPKRSFTYNQLHQVYMLALLGATNKHLSEFFKVDLSAVEYWLRNYPEFAEAKERGGMEADIKVAASLYKRALGFEYTEEEYERVVNKVTGEAKMILKKSTSKYYPPSEKAINTWLRNRQPELWSDAGFKIDQYIHGNVNHRHTVEAKELPLDELSEEERDLLFEIGMKQLNAPEKNN